MANLGLSVNWLALLMLALILILAVAALWAIFSKASVAESQSISILERNRQLSRQIQVANLDLVQIFNAVHVPLFVVQKMPFSVRSLNSACVEFLGESSEGAAQKKLEGLLARDDQASGELVNLRRLLREGVSSPIDVEDSILAHSRQGGDASSLAVTVSLRPVRSTFGQGYIVSLGDKPGTGDQEKLLREYYQLVDFALTEQKLPEALHAVMQLCKSVTATDASIAISIFDDETDCLHYVVEPEKLSESSLSTINRAKIVFGNGIHATAAVLKKEVFSDFQGPENMATDEMLSALKSSGVTRWTALPILGINDELLGTLDFFHFDHDTDARIDFEKLATPFHLASATIERHQSLQALRENARFEGFLRFFNQQLMTTPHQPDDSTFVDAVSKIVSFMQIPAASLRCWMLNEKEDVYRPVGSAAQGPVIACPILEGEKVRRWLASDELLVHKSEFEASLEAEYQCLHLSTDHRMARLMELHKDSDETQQSLTQQFLVFPLSADQTLEGFLVFNPREYRLDRKLNLLSTIAPIMASALGRHRLIESLMHKALHDRLTGLFNRNKIEEALQHELERSQRYDNPLSLILFDIDHFKLINDNFGHDVGDRVLTDMSELVRQKLRAADLIGRWGGEEFIIILTETPLDKAIGIANTIRRDVGAYNFGLGESVTVSMGVAEHATGDTRDSMIKRADVALYEAKNSGRNNVVPSVNRAFRD